MSSYYEKILATGEVKCIDEEIPFEIPQGWEWCRMQDVITFVNGRAYKKEELLPQGKYKVLRVGNFFTNNEWYYSDLELPEDKYCYNGDLLYAWSASFGPQIWNGDKTIFHYHIWNIKFNSMILFREYLYYFFLFDKTQVKASTTGSTMVHVSMENMKPRLIPIPPVNEQKRIVHEIENIIPLIERYGTFQNKKEILDSNIKTTLKKSILQEAIQGKLVPQITEEGTAQELFEQIKTEKQKLVKEGKLKKSALNDSIIFRGDDNKYYTINKKEKICIDDEIPFDIPDTWEWCRLGTLFSHCTGKALNASNLKGQLITYITTSNLYWDRFELGNIKQMRFTDEEIEKCTATFGDLLVCEGGDVGRAAIWNYPYDIRIQNHIHKLRAYKQLCTKFFFWVFYFYKAIGRIGGKGIGIQGLSSKALDNILIPLPPLKEQQRIVAQIEKLFEQLH